MIKPPQCPICERPLVGATVREGSAFPFCSERCQRVDFFRWCDGKYAIVEPLDPGRMAAELEQRRAELVDADDGDDGL
ncbi:MAG: DNA gyrase inhibitor YacG [Planctomycetia bacterium]|nr:DNA gyrase inhibitor YacG [Planctomycetia bacterium]